MTEHMSKSDWAALIVAAIILGAVASVLLYYWAGPSGV